MDFSSVLIFHSSTGARGGSGIIERGRQSTPSGSGEFASTSLRDIRETVDAFGHSDRLFLSGRKQHQGSMGSDVMMVGASLGGRCWPGRGWSGATGGIGKVSRGGDKTWRKVVVKCNGRMALKSEKVQQQVPEIA